MSNTYTVKMQELTHRIDSLEQKTNNTPIGYDVVYTTYKDPGDYVYYGTFVVAFGEGVHREGEFPYLTRLFANGEEIFNTFTGTFKPGLKFKYFNGSEEQDIVYRDMNYRGLMCVVFTDLNLTDYGNNIPAITAEFYDSATVVAGTYQQKGFYSTTWPIKSVQLSPDLGRFHASGQDVPDTYMPGWFPTPPLSIKSVILDTSTLGLVSNISPPFGRFEIVDDTRTAWITEARARFVYTDYGPLSTDKRLQLESDTEIGVVSGPLFIPTAFIPASAGGNSGSAVAPVRGLARMRLKSGATTRHYAVMYNVNGGNRDYSIWYYDPSWRLRWAAQGSGVGPWFSTYDPAYPSTVIPGRETDGESVMYVQTHREIARLVCRPTGDHTVGVIETIKFYENTTDRNIQQCFYDSVNDRVIALNIMADGINAQFVSINQDGSIAWTSEEFPKPSQKSGHLDGEGTSDLSAGTLVVTRETTPRILTRLDTATGEVLAYKAPTTTFKADQLTVWDSRFTRLWVSDLSYVNVGAQEPISGGSTDAFQGAYTISELMTAYAKHVGFTADEIVTVNLDHMKVYGYVYSGGAGLPDIAANLGSLYGFNWFLSANTVTFKSVYDEDGKLVVDLTLTEDDIATSEGMSTNNFSVAINDDNASPAKTTFTYFDINAEYKAGTVKAMRGMDPLPTHKSTAELNFTVPVTMEAKQAQELLYGMLSRAWAGKVSYGFRVPSDGIIINPIDVINFTVNGYSYNGIVTQPRVNADFSVSLTLTEAAGAVHPAKVEVQPPRVIPSFAKPARVLLFDMPDLKTGLYETDFFNLLAIAGSYDRLNFTGAVLEEISQDNPRDVQPVLSFGADEQGYIGTVEQAPMAWPEYEYLDTFNSLIIHADNIPADKFVSATVEEMAADKNLIIIGTQSRVEVMAFGSAEALGDNRWRLTNLLRGRYGTDVNIGLVSSSAGFAFLENYKLYQVRKEVVADQIPLNFRGRNSRQPAWTVEPEQIRIVGNSRKPYAPVNVYGKRDEDGNVFFEWVRRARFVNNPEIPFEPQPPLDELVNRWRIKIWDSEFSFVYRQDEFEAFVIDEDDLPQYIYDITMQESEFNVLGDVAYVTLEQISFPNGFGLNALVVYGFTHKYVVPIIPFGSVMLKARISGEGELNSVVEVTPVSTIRGVIQGGGELTAIMLEAVRLSGTIAGAGELVAVVAEPQPVSGAIAAGGALSGAIPAPVFLGAAIAGEGVLSVDLSVIPAVVISAVIEGGGELVASASADRELVGTIEAGGELTASVVIPKVITGTMVGGGELSANAYITKPVAGTIEAGGAMTANVTNNKVLAATMQAGGLLTANIALPVIVGDVQYLLIGGGGGGGNGGTIASGQYTSGGGGGAGRLLTGTMELPAPGSYAVVVGAGGAQNVNGGASSLAALTAPGGGGGAYYSAGAQQGGNGGGGRGWTPSIAGSNGAPSVDGLGFAGGNGVATSTAVAGAGGGGGVGGAGADGVAATSGAGGGGITSSITGAAVSYGRGGRGGSNSATAPASGPANSGWGGEGARYNIAGGAGGSGVVVIRYPGAPRATGGTITTVAGDTVHTFTTSGTLVVGTPVTLSGAIGGEGGLLGNVEIPVPSTFAAALYTRSVDAAPDTASSPRLVSFDSTVFENGGFTLENGTDVVIPSGVNFIDISASVKITDNVNTTGFAIYVMKNGGYYTIKSTRNTATGFADNQLRIEMPGVPVNPGDRIAIRYSEISVATIQVLAKYTYLGIKKAEG